jgi:hypothetical protein
VLPLVHAEDGRFGEMKASTWDGSLRMFDTFQLGERKLTVGDAVDYGVLERVYGK